jgi:uncharacterized protein YgiM (DUF1202 family)
MAGWLVTQGDRQTQAADLGELKQMAAAGTLGPGDLVQPPGASDWLYALELEELAPLFPDQHASTMDDDDWQMPQRSKTPAIIILAIIAIAGSFGMYTFMQDRPKAGELDLLGPNGLQLNEMLVTADATIRSEPSPSGAAVGTIKNGSTVQLVAKRNKWYTVQTKDGKQGYVSVKDVMPAYVFSDSATREAYDPIYNPDRYVFVKNSSWMQLPDQRELNTTLFQFMMQNTSKFEMNHLVLVATIKDKNDKQIERKEIRIEGSVPKFDSVMVGTLSPPEDTPEGPKRLMTEAEFRRLAKADPSLSLRWAEGVEVMMESEGFVEANIDLLEVRAVPLKK